MEGSDPHKTMFPAVHARGTFSGIGVRGSVCTSTGRAGSDMVDIEKFVLDK